MQRAYSLTLCRFGFLQSLSVELWYIDEWRLHTVNENKFSPTDVYMFFFFRNHPILTAKCLSIRNSNPQPCILLEIFRWEINLYLFHPAVILSRGKE